MNLYRFNPKPPPLPPIIASVDYFQILPSNISLYCSQQALDYFNNPNIKYPPLLHIPPPPLWMDPEIVTNNYRNNFCNSNCFIHRVAGWICIDCHPKPPPPPPITASLTFYKCCRPTYHWTAFDKRMTVWLIKYKSIHPHGPHCAYPTLGTFNGHLRNFFARNQVSSLC